MATDVISILICIFGCLVALLIAVFQLRSEIRRFLSERVFETHSIHISSEDVRKIVRLVIDEINKSKAL